MPRVCVARRLQGTRNFERTAHIRVTPVLASESKHNALSVARVGRMRGIVAFALAAAILVRGFAELAGHNAGRQTWQQQRL